MLEGIGNAVYECLNLWDQVHHRLVPDRKYQMGAQIATRELHDALSLPDKQKCVHL